MTEKTLEWFKTDDGFDIVRSDGVYFRLRGKAGGNLVLHQAKRNEPLPPAGLVEIDSASRDLRETVIRWVLAYPAQP